MFEQKAISIGGMPYDKSAIIYFDQKITPKACILYFHGGGLLYGHKDDQEATLTEGGYIFSPEGNKIAFENKSGQDAKMYVYKRRYDRIEGYSAHTVVANVNDMEWVEYEGMNNCHIKDLLPAAGDFGFDMNMHILKFKLGASHGYIETHIQEHGMYFLSGKGMYRLAERDG